MKKESERILDELIARYPALGYERNNILGAFLIIYQSYCNGNKLLLCGNGGSAADCEHIAGELMKCFRKKRPVNEEFSLKLRSFGEEGRLLSEKLEKALPAIALTDQIALSTAIANDIGQNFIFAQRLYGIARSGDVLLAISTSGNSQNCVYAALTAKAAGLKVIALTGAADSRLSGVADVTVRVPETETYKVQELHLPVYHCLCAMLEEELF